MIEFFFKAVIVGAGAIIVLNCVDIKISHSVECENKISMDWSANKIRIDHTARIDQSHSGRINTTGGY
jgi:hypothetical protein